MNQEEFLKAKLIELEKLTGIHESRWSRYFNQKLSINERTLYAAAEGLEMEPEELLSALIKKRRLITKKLT